MHAKKSAERHMSGRFLAGGLVASPGHRVASAAMDKPLIYHMCRAEEWARAAASGFYPGSSQDAADGFIHFSTAGQLPESAAKHRAGQQGLVLLAVDPERLGTALRWEVSRGGEPFPHLYGALPVAAVVRAEPMPLGADGRHILPPLG